MHHSNQDSFHNRAQSLEDAFFIERDADLLAAIRRQMDEKEKRELLIAATGVEDEAVLPELASVPNFHLLMVVGLFPLVQIAWSDHHLADAERALVLKFAEELGVKQGSASQELLSHWLERKPPENASQLWSDYVQALCGTLKPETVATLKSAIFGRVRKVASAEGGMFGFGRPISATEKACIADMETAFSCDN